MLEKKYTGVLAVTIGLFLLTIGMYMETRSMLVGLYYLFFALVVIASYQFLSSKHKHKIYLLSFVAIYVSPYLFHLTMEQFEELFFVLPIIFTLLYPSSYLVNAINIALISMYFLYPGDEAFVDLVEDALEIIIIGYAASVISVQYGRLKDKIKELHYETNYDDVCGIRNKHALFSELKMCEKDEEKSVILTLFSIKDYKLLQNFFSISHTDVLMKSLVHKINNDLQLKQELFRINQDEFAILSKGIKNIEGTIMNLSKIHDERFEIDSYLHHLDLNIGSAIYPEDTDNISALYNLASYALHDSEQTTDNSHIRYNDQLSLEVEKRFDMVYEIKKGLLNNQFYPHYQPKVDVKTNKIIGAEALVRWQHPVRGMIFPNDFIEVCESSGLIVELSYKLMEKVFLDYQKITQTVGERFNISINISGIQLKQNDFSEKVKEIIDKTGIPIEGIEFEITESTLLENIDEHMDQLIRLKEYGVSLSMDDFGVEYSSFSYLKRLPVDVLKLDRVFVLDLEKSESDRAIIETMIKMGQNLSLKVLVEGIETEEQLRIIKDAGADYYQGYLKSKPVELDKLLELF